jgi:hypothetical protein
MEFRMIHSRTWGTRRGEKGWKRWDLKSTMSASLPRRSLSPSIYGRIDATALVLISIYTENLVDFIIPGLVVNRYSGNIVDSIPRLIVVEPEEDEVARDADCGVEAARARPLHV